MPNKTYLTLEISTTEDGKVVMHVEVNKEKFNSIIAPFVVGAMTKLQASSETKESPPQPAVPTIP